MIRILRPLAQTCLILALMLGSVTMALARNHAQAARQGTEIVICAGYGLVTVTLDNAGNPIGPVHDCPDCTAAGGAILPQAQVATQMPLSTSLRAHLPPQNRLFRAHKPSQHPPRGPPLLI